MATTSSTFRVSSISELLLAMIPAVEQLTLPPGLQQSLVDRLMWAAGVTVERPQAIACVHLDLFEIQLLNAVRSGAVQEEDIVALQLRALQIWTYLGCQSRYGRPPR